MTVVIFDLVSCMASFDQGTASVFDLVRVLRFLQHFASTYFSVLHQCRSLRIAYNAKVVLVCFRFELHDVAEELNFCTLCRQIMAKLFSLAQGRPQIFLRVRTLVHLINALFHHAPTRS